MKVPDIIKDSKSKILAILDKVGMQNIKIPIISPYTEQKSLARIDAFTSLSNPSIKGIHMSRLFTNIQNIFSQKVITEKSIKLLLSKILNSQIGIADKAFIKISFSDLIERNALLSENKGWQTYPLKIKASYDGKNTEFEYQFKIYYSSTCPCSAALARQSIKDSFLKETKDKKFLNKKEISQWLDKESSINAIPHSQRSYAKIKIRGKEFFKLNEYINLIEKILKTPVQTAVKREDEQEFARLNAKNLMFCEDACRIIKNELEKKKSITDYAIKVKHMESLHYHDAVAKTTKGVINGFSS